MDILQCVPSTQPDLTSQIPSIMQIYKLAVFGLGLSSCDAFSAPVPVAGRSMVAASSVQMAAKKAPEKKAVRATLPITPLRPKCPPAPSQPC